MKLCNRRLQMTKKGMRMRSLVPCCFRSNIIVLDLANQKKVKQRLEESKDENSSDTKESKKKKWQVESHHNGAWTCPTHKENL